MAVDIEDALVGYLLADTGVTSLVGTRITPNKSPAAKTDGSDLPRVVFYRTSSDRVIASGGPTGLINVKIGIQCSAGTYAQAKAVAKAIINSDGGNPLNGKLNGFRGIMQGITVKGVFVDDSHDDFTPPAHSDDLGLHHEPITLTIWYWEN